MDSQTFSRLTIRDLGEMTDEELGIVKDFGKGVQASIDGNRLKGGIDAGVPPSGGPV